MSFNFGPPSSSGGGNLFGSQQPATGSSSPFGTANTNANANANATAASNPPTQSPFGTAGASSGTVFGSGAAQPAAGFMFGKKPDSMSGTGAQNTSGTSAFGAAGGSTTRGLFGSGASTTPAQKPPVSFVGFGAATSTTPAAPPPKSDSGAAEAAPKGPMFGELPKTTSSIFSNLGQPTSSKPTTSVLGGGTAAPSSNPFSFGGNNATNPSATAQPKPAFSLPNTQSVNSAPTFAGFGGAPSSKPSPFGLKPASTTPSPGTAAAKPASNLFGTAITPAAVASPATTTAAAPSVGIFAQNAATPSTQVTTAAPSTTPAAAPSVNFFGAKLAAPSTQAQMTTAAPSTAPAAAPAISPFASALKTPATQAQTTTSAPALATTSAPAATTGLGGFGRPLNTVTPAAAASTATTGAAASAAPAANPLGSTSTAPGLGDSVIGAAPPASSRLKNKTMDEILTRWATDLNKYQKEFQHQAKQVAAWDQILVENTEKIGKLVTKTFQAERDAAEVEKQLSNVEGQQNELEQWLDKYDKEVDEMVQKVGLSGDGGGIDLERERTYKLAEKLTDRLDGLNKDLGDVIDEINGVSAMLSNTTGPDDPLSHVVRVLNSHLQQLQRIDMDASTLQVKVQEAQKQARGVGQNDWRIGTDHAEHYYKTFMQGR